MAGCAKAGRKKNSPSQKRYNVESRWKVNKAKKMARYALKNKPKADVQRGATRAALRSKWVQSGKSLSFNEWRIVNNV